jgi:hypothetical protein
MNLFDTSNSDSQSSLAKLLRSLTGAMPGGAKVARQTTPIGADAINRIMGSPEEFIGRYKEFEDEYFRVLSDPKNTNKFSNIADMDIERSSGKIDLSKLTYQSQQDMKNFFRQRVLQMDNLLPQVGIPGMEFPSGNLYSSMLQYEVDEYSHPASILLNKMFFNVQKDKQGVQALNFGMSNMMNTATLERLAYQAENPVDIIGKRVLTLDVETTDVLPDSQVRQFAYKVGEEDVVDESFINRRMDAARVTKSGQSYRMSDAVNLPLKQMGREAQEMGEGGINFVERSKTLFTEMLNADHVSGHNALFDLNKMGDTLRSLDAFNADNVAQDLMNQVFQRVNTQKDYLIDTSETMGSYFQEKARSMFPNDPDRAKKIVNQMISPEMRAQIDIGGKTAPRSMENISLNSNLLQLIEQDAASGSNEANRIIDNIKQGSHVADVDVALQASADRYRSLGTLDFRFDETGKVIGDQMSEFERYGRNLILRSQAMTPTTDIGSVSHMSDAVFRHLSTNEKGMQGITLTTKASDLGLSSDAEGFLAYSKDKKNYTFRAFGSDADEIIEGAVAKSHITRTLNQARAEGEGTLSTLNVAGRTMQLTRNLADEAIVKTGFNFSQATAIDQSIRARDITAGITAGDDDSLIRSLGLTNEQFGKQQTFRNISQRIKGAFTGGPVHQIENPLTYSDEAIDSYYRNAAGAGLPYSSLNVQSRAFSVGLAEATHSIGLAARGTAAYAANADLTTEMGLSFFKMQDSARMGTVTSQGDYFGSKTMMPFTSLFSVSQNTAANKISDQILSVKAFETFSNPMEDIMSSDLNRFTLSFVSGTGEGESKLASRVNLVWGANQSLDEGKSKQLANFLLDNSETFRDTLQNIKVGDQDIGTQLASITQANKTMTGSQRTGLVDQISQSIRDKGIVVGYVEGDPAEGIFNAAKRAGINLVDNDVNLVNQAMRIAHVDEASNMLVMSAISDTKVDEVIGRSSEVAQGEAANAFSKLKRLSEVFNDSSKKRQAAKVVLESKNASSLDRIVDLSKRASRDFDTPMTDFFVKNKKTIGLAGLGLAAAGIGYYMYNNRREEKNIQETMAYMPTEPASNRTFRQMQPPAMPQSTRRDPLVTAGVVGNLDRNKVGHTKMGPNKNNHLYGG